MSLAYFSWLVCFLLTCTVVMSCHADIVVWLGVLGESIKIQKDKTKLSVTTELPMSKRYTFAMLVLLFSLLYG